MTRAKIIIDCDPGQDDAINLLMAFAAPEALDVLGVTAVSGNLPLAVTERNIRILCELAGRTDVPVFAGCTRPMVLEPVHAGHIHGADGIDGMRVYAPTHPLGAQHAVNWIVDTLMAAAPASITLVPTGPLTNIAMALVMEPRIAGRIERIVLMGGAMREGGNYTASAEFNIRVDPHAADVVFRCGRPITAFGLDVSHQLLGLPHRLARIAALGNPVAEAAHGMLAFFNRHDSAKYGTEGAPLHDPCTIGWLLRPELFQLKPCHVAIETGSALTMGHTAVDFWGVSGRAPNCDWAQGVDADGFFDLLTKLLARY